MSIVMLGDTAMEVEHIDKSSEKSKVKKSSPSITKFFQTTESEKTNKNVNNKNNIKHFFLASPPEKSHGIQEQLNLNAKASERESKSCVIEDIEQHETLTTAHTTLDALSKQSKPGNLSKKGKPKWSLAWKVSKKSKYHANNESDSDFDEISENLIDQKDESLVKKGKAKRKSEIKGSNEQEEAGGNRKKGKDEEDTNKNMRADNDFMYEMKGEVDTYKMEEESRKESEPMSVQDALCSQKTKKMKKKGSKKATKPSDKDAGNTPSDATTTTKKTEDTCLLVTGTSMKSNDTQTHKKKDNALEMLMNRSKKTETRGKEENQEITEVGKTSKQVAPIDLESSVEVIECSEQDDKLSFEVSASSATNAFDVLMMKKSSSDDVIPKVESPKKSRHKANSFKLSIRYSKSKAADNDSGSETKEDDSDLVCVRVEREEQQSMKPKKKSKRKEPSGKDSECSEEHMHVDDKPFPSIEETSSDKHGEKSRKSSKSKKKKKRVNKTESDQSNLAEQPHEPKMTKVKKRKRKIQESTKANRVSQDVPIEVQEDSSVQEIIEKDGKTYKSKSHSNIMKSPGIDDFEVTPARTGLRKRTTVVNYALMNECIVKSNDSKKEKKEKKQKKVKESPVVIPDSSEVEIVMSCQATKKDKAAPQKLASIFVKQKPKEKLKSDSKPTQDIVEVSVTKTSMQSEKVEQAQASKPINEEEVKAANTAFMAMFASSKTVKAQMPAVQVNQQPAPWPTVNHVTQWNEDDQSDEGLENLHESQKFTLRAELVTDESKKQSRELKLGEFTSSLCDDKVLEKNKKHTHDLELEALSAIVVKKFLSEVSIHFPGVPLRRLYKQYKGKQDEAHAETIATAQESKNVEKQTKKKHKNCSTNDEKESVQEEPSLKRRRSKRKISTQSDDELSEKQLKKVRRRKEREKKMSDDKKEAAAETSVSERLRKKRSREEEDIQHVDKGKRKLARLGKCGEGANEKQGKNEEKEANPESSKRKKRKTMEDELDTHSVSKGELVKSEDSRTSNDDRKAVDKNDLLWTEKYQPECSSEVMGNASAVSRLKSWLEAWKIKREKTLRKELELQKKLLAKQKHKDKDGKKATLEWCEEEYDSDFHLSDEDSDVSDSEDLGLSSAMLVLGPKGSGKTATVYACAKELGYKVFEVNCSSKRSSKQIMSRLEEATQSHLVITNPSANIPKSSAFGGLFANIADKTNNTSPFTNFISKADQKEDKSSKSERQRTTGNEKKGKGNGKEKKGERIDSSSVLTSSKSDPNHQLSRLKAISLILFEEVDLVFEDDKGFWSAVTSFINNAKCPIIMTSNDSRVECDGRYEQLLLKTPSVNLLSAHLQLAALVNNVLVHPVELKTLVSLYNCDIRKCLLALQFWFMSGGGRKMKWKKFMKQMKNESGIKEESAQVNVEVQSSSKDQALALLDDPGEESLFLTLDDWKTLAKRQSCASKCGQIAETEDVDSDFEAPKTCNTAVDENTHTDSILVESNESQSIQIMEDEDKGVVMPGVQCMLVEHAMGILNNTLGYRHGSMDLLKDRDITDDVLKVNSSITKYRLMQYSQSLGLNLVSSNLPSLLPALHPQHLTNELSSSVTKATKETSDSKIIQGDEKAGVEGSMFVDRSVFDDGTESNEGDSNHGNASEVAMATKGSSSHGVSQKHSTTQHKVGSKEETSTKILHKKTLDIFTTIAEDLSFMDAYTPNVVCDDYRPSEYGWWHAHATSGLSDDVVTVDRTACDWWTQDTSVCIRGALEVASLECSYARCKTINELTKENGCASNDKSNGDGLSTEVIDCLPGRPQSSLVNWTGLTDLQSGQISKMNKLYRTVNSSLPLVTFCSHHATCTEYLPTLRSICHSERLREIANMKRRFLHYLDSISTMSNSTMQSLADAYLAP